MNEQQRQYLLLNVGPLSDYSQQQVEHARRETRKSQVESFCIEYVLSLPSVKAAIYKIRFFFHVFRRLKNTVQDIHFVL